MIAVNFMNFWKKKPNLLQKIASQEKYDFKKPKEVDTSKSPGAMSIDTSKSPGAMSIDA